MTTVVAAISLVAFSVLALRLGLWPSRCPSCRRGLCEHALEDGGLGLRCARCNLDYRRTGGRQLVTVEAFAHGASEPPPEARLAGRRRAQQ